MNIALARQFRLEATVNDPRVYLFWNSSAELILSVSSAIKHITI